MAKKRYVEFGSRKSGNGETVGYPKGKRKTIAYEKANGYSSSINSNGVKRLSKLKADRITKKFQNWLIKIDAEHKLV